MPVLTALVQIQRNLHMLIFTTLSLFYYNIYHFNYNIIIIFISMITKF